MVLPPPSAAQHLGYADIKCKGSGTLWSVGFGPAQVQISPARQRVSDGVAANQTYAAEGDTGEYEAGFWVYLMSDTSTPLPGSVTVSLSVSGTARAGEDYTPLPSSVTLSQDQSAVWIPLHVVEDSVPEWTEDVVVTIMADHAVLRGSGQATMEIVDDDLQLAMPGGILEANFDDDNENNVLDYHESGTDGQEDDLFAVTLVFPTDIKYGATISLSAPASLVTIWSSPQKGRELIGPNAGNYANWTMGQDQVPSTVWLEVTHGSTSEGDIGLVLTAYDGSATSSPVHPTSTQAIRSGTGEGVRFLWTNPETGEVIEAGAKMPAVLVGHRIRVETDVQAPVEPESLSFHWGVTGKTFQNWSATNTSAELTPFDEAYRDGPGVVYSYASPGTSTISCEVQANGRIIPTTPFDVNVRTPTSQLDVTTFGNPAVVDADANDLIRFPWLGFYGPVQQNGRRESGVEFRGSVDVPNEFAPGSWGFVQLVSGDIWGLYQDSNGADHIRRSAWSTLTAPVLDNKFLYGPMYDYEGFVADTSPTNSKPRFTNDTPKVRLANEVTDIGLLRCTEMLDYGDFTMYLMFKPNGEGSQWVPLRKLHWWWRGKAIWTGNGFVFQLSPPPVSDQGKDAPVDTTDHPVWNQNSNQIIAQPWTDEFYG